MNEGKRLHELTTAATATEEAEQTAQNILHYAYGSLSQMDSVQEEIVLDDGDEELSENILRPTDCNPDIKDDNQCVDMVLEEEIITDTQQHDDGEELLMILSMNDDDERPVPPAPTLTSLAGPVAVQSSEKATNKSSISRTQATSSPTATILPLVKIVPNTSSVNSNKIIMKIQAKEPPDVARLDAHASQCLAGEENGEKQPPDEDEDGEDEPTEEEEEEAATTTRADEGKSVKVPREMKQLQQMVDSSKVLTDFMNIAVTTTVPSTGTSNKLTRKSRKTPGRPKKKVQGATVPGVEHDSPKRTSARAMAAMEAADKKKRMFAEIGMDSSATGADDSTEIAPSFDADELSMDYHSDNETNESVASGYTDSMPMKLPKVNSNSSISIVPAPKVSETACPFYHLRLIPTQSFSGGQ